MQQPSPEAPASEGDYPAEPRLHDLQSQHMAPSADSCSATSYLPPPRFSTLRAPPPVFPTGPSLLPPLGYYSPCSSTYGPGGIGSTSAYTHTSWSAFNQPPCTQFAANGVPPPPFSAPYSTYPSPFGGGYGALPPPLHHPEPVADSTVSTSSFPVGRKRPRVSEEDADSDIPAKNCRATVSLELPTPPDSSSDRSGTVSPQNYYPQPDLLRLPSSLPPPTTGLSPPAPPMPQNGVYVSLTAKAEELWNLFYSAHTEMIVTKNGRCLFPLLMFNVSGLARKKEYNISIRAVSSDRYRYKYLHNTWTQVSESEFTHNPRKMIALHPNSPQTGAKWMGKDVDFKSVKITHYPKSKGGDILLNTMHKYYFELVIEEAHVSDPDPLVFPFNLTSFIAVTAYQSAKLTELKKEKNPFARGVKHHESETDAHPVPSRHSYESGVPGFMMSGYGPGQCIYPNPASGNVSFPYPTPWSQNGQPR